MVNAAFISRPDTISLDKRYGNTHMERLNTTTYLEFSGFDEYSQSPAYTISVALTDEERVQLIAMLLNHSPDADPKKWHSNFEVIDCEEVNNGPKN